MLRLDGVTGDVDRQDGQLDSGVSAEMKFVQYVHQQLLDECRLVSIGLYVFGPNNLFGTFSTPGLNIYLDTQDDMNELLTICSRYGGVPIPAQQLFVIKLNCDRGKTHRLENLGAPATTTAAETPPTATGRGAPERKDPYWQTTSTRRGNTGRRGITGSFHALLGTTPEAASLMPSVFTTCRVV